MTALQIAEITNLNRNTINRYLKLAQTLIAAFCEQESPFSGEVECDESYFGSRYQSGKRGRGAENKHIVFGIYKRNGCVYTELVENVKAKTLQAIIKGRVSFDATLYTWAIRNIFGFITRIITLSVIFISTALRLFRTFGATPKMGDNQCV